MTTLVLVRHGESEWNSTGLITGWSDPPLSARGMEQARRAGSLLAARELPVDRVYTSLLDRATMTASVMLAAAGAPSVRVDTDWRLNERHLGRLEGMTKAEVAAVWGNKSRKRWRDDDHSRPPCVLPGDPAHPRHDPRYRHVPVDRLPAGERLCDTAFRVLAVWHERIVPDLRSGRDVTVVSHLGPLRILDLHLSSSDARDPTAEAWANGETRSYPVPGRPCCAEAVTATSG